MNTPSTFVPGERWLATDRQPIQFHGGALLRHGDSWYWYDENKSAHVNATTITVAGVSCYRSTDLINWQTSALPHGLR